MKNKIIILVILLCVSMFFSGCSLGFGEKTFEENSSMRTHKTENVGEAEKNVGEEKTEIGNNR